MASANLTFIGLALLFVILHLICEADENPLDKGQARQRNKRKFPQKETTPEGFYTDGDPFSSPVNMFGSRPQVCSCFHPSQVASHMSNPSHLYPQ
jgi:hypothetical protein